jgi:diacylglycerol kinase (ATP)
MKVCFTEDVGHASELARNLLQEGYAHLITAGGDGTHFETINGCFEDGKPLRPDIQLTVIPGGTGSDLARHLGMRVDRRGACRLDGARTIKADVVRLTCAPEHGAADLHTVYFLNMGRIGMGGAVCRYVNNNTKTFGGFISYLRGLVVTLCRYQDKTIEFTIDGHTRVVGPTKDFTIANASYDAGGMKMAPHARLDDGLLDFYHIGPIGLLDALRSLPLVYSGRLAERADVVRYFRGTTVEARSNEVVDVEVDGESVGYLPASIDILPGTIRMTTLLPDDDQ